MITGDLFITLMFFFTVFISGYGLGLIMEPRK